MKTKRSKISGFNISKNSGINISKSSGLNISKNNMNKIEKRSKIETGSNETKKAMVRNSATKTKYTKRLMREMRPKKVSKNPTKPVSLSKFNELLLNTLNSYSSMKRSPKIKIPDEIVYEDPKIKRKSQKLLEENQAPKISKVSLDEIGHIKNDQNTVLERSLRKIGTLGVVQLFNAINRYQKIPPKKEENMKPLSENNPNNETTLDSSNSNSQNAPPSSSVTISNTPVQSSFMRLLQKHKTAML